MKIETQQDFATLMSLLTKVAWANNQTVGEKNDYYVTLEQIERIMMNFGLDRS